MYKIIGGDGKEYGPVTAEVVREWIAQGRALPQTKVLSEGATEWKALSDLREFGPALASLAAPAKVPGPIVAPQPGPQTNSLAVTGLILGVVSITFGQCCCSGLPFSIGGIICSSLALSQINKNPHQEQGKGLAIAGLVTSIFGILAGLALLLGWIVLSGSHDLMRRIQRL